VQHHPWRSVAAGAVFLAVLAMPIFGLRLGFSDQGNDPTDTTTRKAYDLLADGFGPGFNGTFILVAELPAGTDMSSLDAITTAVQNTPGVAVVTPPRPNDANAPTAAIWTVIPTTSPQDEKTDALIDRLREDIVPSAEQGTSLQVYVGGTTASNIDASASIAHKLPLYLALIAVLGFALLAIAFRSILVPLIGALANLLTLAVGLGAVTAIFQFGWASELLGVGTGAPIEWLAPVMVIGVMFGLSMDYQVFLVSRMH
jgi:RND superfamily putative drug exporter